MPSFKTVAAGIAGLAVVSASSYKHEPVYVHMRSELEDLDLAEGRNPFTGRPMGGNDDMNDILKRLGGMGGGSTKVYVNGVPVEMGANGKYDADIEELFGSLGRFGGSRGGRPSGLFGGRRPTTAIPTPVTPIGGNDDVEERVPVSRPPTTPTGGQVPVSRPPTTPTGGQVPVSRPSTTPAEPAKPTESPKMDNLAGSPFRIKVDYSTLRAPSEKHANYIKDLLMPAVVDFFTSTLRIKYPLKQNQRCPRYSNVEIPSNYITEGVKDADLVILVRCQNDPRSGVVASAGSLVADSRSGRSVLATVNFNFGHIPVDETDTMALSRSIYTTVHELTHVLGFSNDQFKNFLNPDGTRQQENSVDVELGGDRMTLLDVEPLTTRLRKFFGCDKIQGAPMEDDGDEGTAGSHFERRIFFNEYMTGSDLPDARISEFTLALLEGTGWYAVDYSKAEPYTFGKGQGCDFFYGKCNDERGNARFPDFCTKNEERECTVTGNGAASCRIDPYSNNCGLPYAEERLDCRNPDATKYTQILRDQQVFGVGKGSKCFVGSLVEQGYRINQKASYCFNFKCQGTGASATVDVIIGKTTAKCTKKGTITVPGFSGQLDCPDPVQFCADAAPYCSKGCLGRGTCVNGTCQCKPGFKGADCVYPTK